MFRRNSLTVEVKCVTKRGAYLELNIPAVMIVCPACDGGVIPGLCPLCVGRNVIPVADEAWLARHKRIDRAMRRYDKEESDAAWERHGERLIGC